MKFSFKLLLGGMALATSLTAFTAKEAQATCNNNPFMSTVCWTMSYYCPRGYSEANGQYLPINTYQALYSLLGTTYGGDGRTNFALPDLRGRVAVGSGQGPGLPYARNLGRPFGQEDYMLTVANLPAHSHGITMGDVQITGEVIGVSDEGTQVSPTNHFPAARPDGGKLSNRQPYYTSTANNGGALMGANSASLEVSPSFFDTEAAFEPKSTQQALPLRAPQIGVLACIAVQGEYPPRS